MNPRDRTTRSEPGEAAASGTIVITTRNRAGAVLGTLERLRSLPEQWPIIVVDDGSTDGTADRVRSTFPDVSVIRLPRSAGASARNIGVACAESEFVAFADDDSWYAPGALSTATRHLQDHPDVAVLAGRCIVEPDGRLDPVSTQQARSPLPSAPPGPSILGFLACTIVLRRSAFLAVGGFHPLLHFLGEEDVLAMDLRAAGWRLVYASDVTVHHAPQSVQQGRDRRRVRQIRNRALTTWMRRPVAVALATSGRLALDALGDRDSRAALVETTVRLPAALAQRHPLPEHVEAELRTVEAVADPAGC